MNKDVVMSKLAYVFKSVSLTLKQKEYLYQAIKDIVNIAVDGGGESKENIFEVVTSLPNMGSTKKIYLVKVPDSTKGDEYAEYVYNNGNWEQLGNLTGYEKATDIDSKISEVKEEVNIINKNISNITIDIVKNISTNIIEKGVNNIITIDWYVTNNGVKVTPDKFVIKYADKELYNPVNELNISLDDTTEIEFIAIVGDFEKHEVVTVNAYYPIYVGSSSKELITTDDLFTFNKQIAEIPIKDTINNINVKVNNGEYIYVGIPNGNINSITSNNFTIPFDYYMATVSSKGTYNIYRTSSTFISGTYKISIN